MFWSYLCSCCDRAWFLTKICLCLVWRPFCSTQIYFQFKSDFQFAKCLHKSHLFGPSQPLSYLKSLSNPCLLIPPFSSPFKTHTFEEKRRVHRPRDLKVLLHEARRQQQQQHLVRYVSMCLLTSNPPYLGLMSPLVKHCFFLNIVQIKQFCVMSQRICSCIENRFPSSWFRRSWMPRMSRLK